MCMQKPRHTPRLRLSFYIIIIILLLILMTYLFLVIDNIFCMPMVKAQGVAMLYNLIFM